MELIDAVIASPGITTTDVVLALRVVGRLRSLGVLSAQEASTATCRLYRSGAVTMDEAVEEVEKGARGDLTQGL